MNTNVYNIVWADDEIDELLDADMQSDLKNRGFNVVGTAHNGEELEGLLNDMKNIDAVIIDANFNETDEKIENSRVIAGFDYARSLYKLKCHKAIPFFLFTARTDQMLLDIYQYNPEVLKDFPRYKRWFNKNDQDGFNDMLQAIKQAVDENHSINFAIRNRFADELDAASYLSPVVYDLEFEFIKRNYENTLTKMEEPFVRMRKAIEEVFTKAEKLKLIPPTSSNLTWTARYFVYEKFPPNQQSETIYEMLDKTLMPKPLAYSLKYVVDTTQDGAHRNGYLSLKVDEYFTKTKDVLLLCSVVNIIMDVLKWFKTTAETHKDPEINAKTLWRAVKKDDLEISEEENEE